MLPSISITANRTIVAVNISLPSNRMSYFKKKKKIHRLKFGNKILSKRLSSACFEGVVKCTITKDTVANGSKPLMEIKGGNRKPLPKLDPSIIERYAPSPISTLLDRKQRNYEIIEDNYAIRQENVKEP